MRFESRDLIFALLAACIIAALPAALQWRSGNFSGSEKETAKRFPLAERQLALKAAEDLLTASASLASERGLVLAALSAPEPVTSAGRATINERRGFADAAVESAQSRLIRLAPTLDVDRILARFEDLREIVVSQRSEADREVDKSAGLRSVHAIARSFEMPTALIGVIEELVRKIHLELGRVDRGIAGWLEIQRLSLEMAEHAGRERAQVAIYLAADGRAARRQLTAAEYNRHKVFTAWQQMQSTLATVEPQRRIIDQVGVVGQKYFEDHERVRRMLLATNQEPGASTMTAAEWFAHATPAIDAMIEFGRKAGTVAAENLKRET